MRQRKEVLFIAILQGALSAQYGRPSFLSSECTIYYGDFECPITPEVPESLSVGDVCQFWLFKETD